MAKITIVVEIGNEAVTEIQEAFSTSEKEQIVLSVDTLDRDHILDGIDIEDVCASIATEVVRGNFL